MITSLFTLNIAIAAAMLLYTSYLDMKKREVEDRVWIIFGIVGAVLQGYELLGGETEWSLLAIALALSSIIGMGLFYFGFYGGADGKALIVVALLVPYFSPHVGLYSIAPLMVLTNGVLISVILPFFMFFWNLSRLASGERIFDGFKGERLSRKIAACFLGYKQTGRPRAFQFSMERKKQEGEGREQLEKEEDESRRVSGAWEASQTRRFDFSMMRDDFETESGTWVTPGIPLLVFFTAGYFALLFYGDLVIGIIQFLFGAI